MKQEIAGAPRGPIGIARENPDWKRETTCKPQTRWDRLNALPERLPNPKGILGILLFLPIPMAMAEQDCRYVSLIAHETPLFSAFFMEWSVDLYLWQATTAAIWYGLRALHLDKAGLFR
jgi:hypothetical protein